MRQPPGDELPNCAALVAAGHCEQAVPHGRRYFLSQCFKSCGERDASLLLEVMLSELGDLNAFPDGLANRAALVGEVARVEDEGRVVTVEKLHEAPKVHSAHLTLTLTLTLTQGAVG